MQHEEGLCSEEITCRLRLALKVGMGKTGCSGFCSYGGGNDGHDASSRWLNVEVVRVDGGCRLC